LLHLSRRDGKGTAFNNILEAMMTTDMTRFGAGICLPAHRLGVNRWITHLAFAIALQTFQGFAAEERVSLKVFLLAGQSNMQGHAHLETMEHIGMDPDTKPLLDQMTDTAGHPKVSQGIRIAYLSDQGEKSGRLGIGFGANQEKFGPEWTFGLEMKKQLNAPILLIKTAWGGKSLHTDFRPPGAGPYRFNPSQLARFKEQGQDLEAIRRKKKQATGHYYHRMIDYIKSTLANIQRVDPTYQPDRGFELSGFVWFQGWNDMVDRGTYPQRDQPGGYDAYSKMLAHFIQDMRRDLDSPSLPFVIGVMGVGGPVELYLPPQQRYRDIHQNFRDAMAAPARLPTMEGVTALLTEQFWDLKLGLLRARDATLRQNLQQRSSWDRLTPSAKRDKLNEARSKAFTPDEWLYLQKGVSNQEYHYLGSGKIMARIGHGFAQAMTQLLLEPSAAK
jgi:hypothetical protein